MSEFSKLNLSEPIYGKPRKIKYPVLGCIREDGANADILITLLDGSKLSAVVPLTSIVGLNLESKEARWDNCTVKIIVKDGIAKILGTDAWTRESNIIE